MIGQRVPQMMEGMSCAMPYRTEKRALLPRVAAAAPAVRAAPSMIPGSNWAWLLSADQISRTTRRALLRARSVLGAHIDAGTRSRVERHACYTDRSHAVSLAAHIHAVTCSRVEQHTCYTDLSSRPMLSQRPILWLHRGTRTFPSQSCRGMPAGGAVAVLSTGDLRWMQQYPHYQQQRIHQEMSAESWASLYKWTQQPNHQIDAVWRQRFFALSNFTKPLCPISVSRSPKLGWP